MALTKEQIYHQLAGQAQERFALPAEKVSPQLNFAKDTTADSIDVVELVLEVEDEYNLEIPDADLEHLTTLAGVVDYVYEHQG